MLTGQAMSTMGKFVLLCCHFDIVFLKLLVAFFFVILLWHSGSQRDVSAKCILGLWEPGMWSLVSLSGASRGSGDF